MNIILDVNAIKEKAPAVFSEVPAPKASDKYVMIPSYKVIEDMEKFDFYPVGVKQTKSRNEENTPFARHTIRFRHKSQMDIIQEKYTDKTFPELMWVNGHNTRVAAKFLFGLYRLVCSNGLVVNEGMFNSFSTQHRNITMDDIEKVIEQYAIQAEDISQRVKEYKSIELNENDSISFAQKIMSKVWNQNPFDPKELLDRRRVQDSDNRLWTVFNVIQENIIKGGIKYQVEQENGRIRRVVTRGIKDIDKDLRINVALWSMMEEMYNEKRG